MIFIAFQMQRTLLSTQSDLNWELHLEMIGITHDLGTYSTNFWSNNDILWLCSLIFETVYLLKLDLTYFCWLIHMRTHVLAKAFFNPSNFSAKMCILLCSCARLWYKSEFILKPTPMLFIGTYWSCVWWI